MSTEALDTRELSCGTVVSAPEALDRARVGAYASGALFVFGAGTLAAFFAVGQPWGSINDASAALMALSLVPVVPVLHRMVEEAAPKASLAAAWVGTAGMGVMAVSSVLVIGKALDILSFPELAPGTGPYGATIWAGAAIGFWLTVENLLAERTGCLSPTHRRLGVAAGLGYLLGAVGFATAGLSSPLSAFSGLLLFAGFPYWALRLGRRLGEARLKRR